MEVTGRAASSAPVAPSRRHQMGDCLDRFDAMRVLVAAVDQGSLAGAARALQRSPASIGRTIAFLEQHVGAPLLHRSTRALRLSTVGETYAAACRRILAEVEDAERLASEARAGACGTLTLSVPASVGQEIVLPVVMDFLRAHPAVDVRIFAGDHDVSMIDEGIDVALRIGTLPDSALVAVKLGAGIRKVVAAAPDYLARRAPLDRPCDLAQHRIVALAAFGAQSWTFRALAGSPIAQTVAFTPRIVVNSVPAALAGAVDGLGVTRLYAHHLIEPLQRGTLQIVLADAEPPPLPAHLVTLPARNTAPKVRAFLDLATPRLRAHFSQLAADTRTLQPPGLAA
jgi:DNA-binding transcriptional LysR family regulator